MTAVAASGVQIADLRRFFESGATRPLKVRSEALKALGKAIRSHEKAILEALHQDLGKSAFEAYGAEVGLVLDEIKHVRRHLGSWVKPRYEWPSLAQLPARTYIQYEPRGVVLIIAPWNYPFQLTLVPLIGAIAAGNVAVLKPSEFAPATEKVLQTIIREALPPQYVQVVTGDAAVSASLIEEDWDYIFFTGGTRVGRLIAESAGRRLIPYTLELGGKSPVIVTESAKLSIAARRIAWGKWLNAGQTCIAPDYVLISQQKLRPFLTALREAVEAFYGADLQRPPTDYARIIHRAHYDRLVSMLAEGEVCFGGYTDPEKLYISPTILLEPKGRLVEEEIFGPLLPIIPYESIEEARAFIRQLPPPLALYVFTERAEEERFFLEATPAGGSCINDTVLHVASARLPFGGVRQSGTGRYHGWYSFETFSHARPIVKTPTWIDLPLRYPPYGKKLSLIRWLLG
jgi:aldehyde dehydrogenase (NAD+)